MNRLPRLVIAVVLGIGALALASCSHASGAHEADATPHVTVLDGADQPLRDDFNRDKGTVRLMFLVDPICPGCLRGLADMGDDVLAQLPAGARVKVYVVYEPVIGGRDKDIPAAAALLNTRLAKHYWNPTGDFGREMSHALGYWNGWRWVYAWDTWLIYPPDAVWVGQTLPKPAFLMHQLGGLADKFPHLDSKVFAAKVDQMVAKLDKKGAPR